LLIKVTTNPVKVEPIGYVHVLQTVVTSYPQTSYFNKKKDTPKAPACANSNLKWNEQNKRFEAAPGTTANLTTPKDDTEETLAKILAALKDLGYTPSEIIRMSEGTKARVLAHGIYAKDVHILTDGELLFHTGRDGKEEVINNTKDLANKYFLKGMTHDFKGWQKLTAPNRGHVSADGTLLKKWDKEKNTHYIMDLVTALKEGLILDKEALQNDLSEFISTEEVGESEHTDVQVPF
jgi:hypothetical protein